MAGCLALVDYSCNEMEMRKVEKKTKKAFSSPNMCREGFKSLSKKDVEQVIKHLFNQALR